MRAILIDPTDKSVSEIDFDGKYETLKTFSRSGWVERVSLPDDHWLWVDEEGLLQPEPGPFFALECCGDANFAGKGLILGDNGEEDHASATVPLETIRRITFFPSVRFTGFTDKQTIEQHPIFGEMSVFSRKANFEEIE